MAKLLMLYFPKLTTSLNSVAVSDKNTENIGVLRIDY